MHYQKKCNSCLCIAGEKYDSGKFNIFVPDSIYSGGNISVKKVNQLNFEVKKMSVVIDTNNYIKQVQFYVSGKKNIAAFDQWISTQISPQLDLGQNIFLLRKENQTLFYASNRRKHKIAVTIAKK